jgi:hypothetical protein
MLQLNPPLLFLHEGRKCTAFMAIDYSQEHELLLLCGFDDTRELWILPHTRLRMQDNISLGRMRT